MSSAADLMGHLLEFQLGQLRLNKSWQSWHDMILVKPWARFYLSEFLFAQRLAKNDRPLVALWAEISYTTVFCPFCRNPSRLVSMMLD